MVLTQPQIDGLDYFRNYPDEFVREALGSHMYDRQVEMARAVQEHPRVSVVGCNGSGKDWASGRIILHWMITRYPAKVVVVGPTWRQVHDIVWNEVRAAYNSRRIQEDWGLRLFDSPRLESLSEPEKHFAVGLSTTDPYNLQGYHSPNLLVVVTEAHAVKQSHIEALRRLNPKRLLLTGNAFATRGEFYESHHGSRDLWYPVTISAYDTPNLVPHAPDDGKPEYEGMVTRTNIEQRKVEWGEQSPMYLASVLAKFPDSLDDTIVPLWAAVEAANRTATAEGNVILACDVARFGQDRTVVVERQGDVARIKWRVQGRNTMEIAGWLGAYVADNHVDTVVVDDTGVGGGVVDRLREISLNGARLVPFQGGASARDKEHYSNAIAESWMLMRKWFLDEDGHADIENDNSLISQISGRGYTYQSDKTIRLESKKDMVKSPDEADALAMTFAQLGRPPRVTFLQ
jgi:phage terminase large subunit